MADSSNEEKNIQVEVQRAIEQAHEFTRSIDFKDVQSGDWFIKLLQQVIVSYQKNTRSDYFQQKYPGLPPDDIAEKLISATSAYAAVAGSISGLAVSAQQVALLGSAGMTIPLFIGTIGAEMVYLASIQMRLILDLSVVYDLQLNAEDPEDVLMIFGYGLGAKPAQIIGKGIQIAAGGATKTAIKTFISKGTLKAVQDFARLLGFKILQRTIIKYAVPGVSAAVGSGYNYATTVSMGNIAKNHFKNRGKVTDELRSLISRQYTYDLVFPAAVLYMAQIDGEFHEQEQQLYNAVLTRMTFDEHDQEEFQWLMKHEDHILNAIAELKNPVAAQTLMDLLTMMALYDGTLADTEKEFLIKAGTILGIPVDSDMLERQIQQYRPQDEKALWSTIADSTGKSFELAKQNLMGLFKRENDDPSFAAE